MDVCLKTLENGDTVPQFAACRLRLANFYTQYLYCVYTGNVAKQDPAAPS